MLKPVNYTIVPGVTVVAASLSLVNALGIDDVTMELIVLGESVACLDAVLAHSGSLARQVLGRTIPAEDIFSHWEMTPGVSRFVLG